MNNFPRSRTDSFERNLLLSIFAIGHELLRISGSRGLFKLGIRLKMVRGIVAQLAQLRDLLHAMEAEVGLSDLTPNERDVLLACFAHLYTDENGDTVCQTDAVRRHPTVARLSQPTFHRTLKRLMERGYVHKSESWPLGVYSVSVPPIQNAPRLATVAG